MEPENKAKIDSKIANDKNRAFRISDSILLQTLNTFCYHEYNCDNIALGL